MSNKMFDNYRQFCRSLGTLTDDQLEDIAAVVMMTRGTLMFPFCESKVRKEFDRRQLMSRYFRIIGQTDNRDNNETHNR
jgi:hypothetical protein